MKLIKDETFVTTFGISYGIGIEINGNIVIEKPIPTPDISAESLLESTVEASYRETVDGDLYLIQIHSSLENVKVNVFGDMKTTKKILIVLLHNYECPLLEDSSPSLRIETYVPIIKYTRTAKDTYKFAQDGSNKHIIPCLDIRKEEQIEEYISNRFDIPHFLDLGAIQKDINTEKNAEITLIRKEEKKRGVLKEDRTEFHKKEYINLAEYEKVKNYLDLSHLSSVIPVWRISTENKPSFMEEYSELVKILFTRYDSHLAFRVMNTKNFITNIESYLSPLKGYLHRCYLIIEFLGDDRNYELECIKKIEDLECDIQIVFAKQTLDYEHTVIKMNHFNLMPNTSLGSFYEHLPKAKGELWYADYCGYDRDTATTYIGGMKPSSSLYLLNYQDGMEMMILKIKHKDERGTGARTKSPKLLAEIVKQHPHVKSFVYRKHCESCKFICDALTFTLENAKVACMKHNVRVIATL